MTFDKTSEGPPVMVSYTENAGCRHKVATTLAAATTAAAAAAATAGSICYRWLYRPRR
eukprot:COSAG02_NODE_27235_length_614_cov_0.900971_2_plen_57_part_01